MEIFCLKRGKNTNAGFPQFAPEGGIIPPSLSCYAFFSKKSHFLLFQKAIKLWEFYALSGQNEYRKLLHFGKIFRQVKKNATVGIFDKASGKPATKKLKEAQ